jgi:hypothetical protein
MDELLRRIHAEVASNPPLGYEPDEAAALFFKAAKQEVATSKEEVGGGKGGRGVGGDGFHSDHGDSPTLLHVYHGKDCFTQKLGLMSIAM